MDLEKFMQEVKDLKEEREVLAKRVVELEMENKTIKKESKEIATALSSNIEEVEKLKSDITRIEELIDCAKIIITKQDTEKDNK